MSSPSSRWPTSKLRTLDLDRHLADVSGRGLAPEAIERLNKGVRLSAIRDPEGNTITFIGNFRVKY